MLAFGHNSIGALIGVATFSLLPEGTPLSLRIGTTFVLSVISHYLTDRIPHGHYEFSPAHLSKKMAALFLLDFGGSMMVLGLCAFLKIGFSPEFLLIFAGMWGAQLPDIFEGLVNIGVIPSSSFVKKHRTFHYEIMHAKTPHQLLLLDGVSRAWSRSDLWQVGCFTIAAVAIIL